ncbi:uncharacterized protein TNCT_98501 [Trichonephila clavata]|uniref:Uncharacterized protein n=1 Tax=Trichonephila clavata TaxID=2740835 RepID=A0A8X6GKB0_TRICU|nr:uncharacterized protein TNCT_98501 [Trichonephila clavata]
MNEMMDLNCSTNFSMLTEYLHNLFKRYIINGRVRAPPEYELTDMIPTFQLGAKTNRRALQSKFKSWARRMTVINGNLVLSSSGKIIIPQEKCEELIMELHSKKHLSVDQVVAQIQRKYTWQKKNFGMDLEIVMNAISTNCDQDECRNEIGKEFKTYKKKIYSAVPVSSISWPIFQQPKIDSYKLYEYSRECPQRNTFSSKHFPILKNYLNRKSNSVYDLTGSLNSTSSRIQVEMQNKQHKNYEKVIVPNAMNHFGGFAEKEVARNKFLLPKLKPMINCHIPQTMNFTENKSEILLKSNQNYLSESLHSWDSNDSYDRKTAELFLTPSCSMYEGGSYCSKEDDDSSKHSRIFTKACKKPRNFYEFKILLKGAQNDPETHPAILTSSKTQFLGTLGLVPKRICSQRTLTKFSKELRKKSLIEKRRGRFVERKVLRDRNKLNKRSSYRLKMKHQSYADYSKPSYHRTAIDITKRVRNSSIKKLKSATKRPLKQYFEKSKEMDREFRPSVETARKEPEVIDIASSDEERNGKQNNKTTKAVDNSQNTDYGNQTYSANSVQNDSLNYANPNLLGYDAKRNEERRNQMIFRQGLGYGSTFDNRSVFLNQNSIANLLIPSNNPRQQEGSFYRDSQEQFPVLRPFFIPALTNGEVAVLQVPHFPLVRPVRPVNSANTAPYFPNIRYLPKNIDVHKQSNKSPTEEPHILMSNGNAGIKNETNNANVTPTYHANSAPSEFKIFLVNKNPKKAYLLVPPNNQTLPNDIIKTVPSTSRKIAPRINDLKKIREHNNGATKKENNQRRVNNVTYANATYSGKRKGT